MNSPNHIAFIVDGNRRWAKKRALRIIAGHQKAVDKNIEDIVFYCLKHKIPYVTFWAFSTENWKRGEKFTKSLFGLLAQTLEKNVDKYHQAGIRLNIIGNINKLPEKLVNKIKELQKKSKTNKNLTVTIALNYGGRDEIIRAIKKIPTNKLQGLNEIDFSKYLDTHDLPDPDIIVRTGGEQRLSGFLLWQGQYSELFFINTLFPDFNLPELEQILHDFAQRDRRLGK